MAATTPNAYCSSSHESFNLPPEPSPLSSMDLSDDSFVILWKDGDTITVKEITEPISSDGATQNRNENSLDVSNVTTVCSDISNLSSADFQEKVIQVMEENTVLNERLAENNKIMNVQQENILTLEQYYHQAQEQKKFIEMLQKENHFLTDEVEQLRITKNVQDKEIDCLKETLAKPSQSSSVVEDLKLSKKEIVTLKKENFNLTMGLKQLRSIKDAQDEDMDELKQGMEELHKERDELFEDLELAKREIEEIKIKLAEVKAAGEEKQKSLSEEITSLKSQLQLAEERPCVEDLARVEEQYKRARVMMMQLEQSKLVADSQIEGLSREILHLREELQESQTQMDQVYTLKAQLAVYKMDYDTEKRAKRIIKNENMTLLEEVQNLRICCQQLQEEVNVLRELEVAPRCTENLTVADQPGLCPICGFGFQTTQALQNHVERCLITSANDQ